MPARGQQPRAASARLSRSQTPRSRCRRRDAAPRGRASRCWPPPSQTRAAQRERPSCTAAASAAALGTARPSPPCQGCAVRTPPCNAQPKFSGRRSASRLCFRHPPHQKQSPHRRTRRRRRRPPCALGTLGPLHSQATRRRTGTTAPQPRGTAPAAPAAAGWPPSSPGQERPAAAAPVAQCLAGPARTWRRRA